MTLPRTSKSARRRKEAEAWWAFLARVLSFFLGGTILAAEAFGQTTDRLYLTVAAVGLMGPTVASAVAQVFEAMRGSQNQEPEK